MFYATCASQALLAAHCSLGYSIRIWQRQLRSLSWTAGRNEHDDTREGRKAGAGGGAGARAVMPLELELKVELELTLR